MRPRRRSALAALALLAALAPAAAARADDVPVGRATPVREYAGIVVFSTFEDGQYFLTVQRPGSAPQRLPGGPRTVPFDADIGTDSSGKPELVYSRDGELFTFSLARGDGERPIRNADDPGNDDVSPTLWRGRLAWTRVYKSGPVVYTKTLTAPRSRPSERLPGVPSRNGTTEDRTVEALELYGQRLAEVVRYTCPACAGISTTEVRLANLDGSVEQIARMTTGLSGQSWIGPSFHDGTLGFSKTCLGDPAACQNGAGGPYRVRYTAHEYTRAAGPARVDGFADGGDTLYEVSGCTETPEPVRGDCALRSRAAPRYQATTRPG